MAGLWTRLPPGQLLGAALLVLLSCGDKDPPSVTPADSGGDGVACKAGLTDCAGSCRELQKDPQNCGACGNLCGVAEVCSLGKCALVCPAKQVNCSGTCRDLASDSSHCGACNSACPAGQLCVAGKCALSCQSGLTNCSGSCRDLTSDAAHCGKCANACQPGQVCSSGSCALSCQKGLSSCGGTCRDLSSDAAHCGKCNTPCSSGHLCVASKCALTCQAGFSNCGGSCRDLKTDPTHCGKCNNTCPAGHACAAATCALSCQTGLTNCSGTCRDLTSDASNCGSCGGVCGWGAVCSGGACVSSCKQDADCKGQAACVKQLCKVVACTTQAPCKKLGLICNQGFCAQPGFGVKGKYSSSDTSIKAPGKPGAQWPTRNADHQRTRTVKAAGAHLTHPLPLWRFPLGQNLTRNSGLVAGLLPGGLGYASLQGGRVVIRRADGALQARSRYLGAKQIVGAADLEGSGQPVVVVASSPAAVQLVDPVTGQVLFAITNFPAGVSVTAVLAPDVTGDKLPELAIWASGFAPKFANVIGIYSFASGHSAGKALWWKDWSQQKAYLNPPLFGDLLGLKNKQMVVLPNRGNGPVTVFEALTGKILAQPTSGLSICPAPSSAQLRDLDGDGDLEIVLVSDPADIWCHEVGAYDVVKSGGSFAGKTVTCGTPHCVVRRWIHQAAGTKGRWVILAPWEDALVDLDADKKLELVYAYFDEQVGYWQTRIVDAASGTVLLTQKDYVPLDLVSRKTGGATMISLAAPNRTLSWTGNVSGHSYSRSTGKLSQLWSRSKTAPLWRTWRPVPAADRIAIGTHFSAASAEGPGLVALDAGGTDAVLLLQASAAVPAGGRPDTLALVGLATGKVLATSKLSAGDQLTGFEQIGSQAWLSSRLGGIELWNATASSLTRVQSVPGGGYLAPAPLVLRNNNTPELFVQDATGQTRVLALPQSGGGALVKRGTVPYYQKLVAISPATGAGATRLLVQESLGGSSPVKLQELGATKPLWTLNLTPPTLLLRWADAGRYGASAKAGFVLQLHDAIDKNKNLTWAVDAGNGTTIWKDSGNARFAGRGGSVLDYNGDKVDDAINCSNGNNCILYDGATGKVTVKTFSGVGIPTNVAVVPAAGSQPTRLYIGGAAYYTTCWELDQKGLATPQWSVSSGSNSAVALADVNADKVLDAVYYNDTDNLVARHGLTGKILWQQGLHAGKKVPASLHAGRKKSAPAVADIDGDGKPEIVVTAADGWLYALEADGSIYFAMDFATSLSAPVIADVTGKGEHAILVTAADGNLYVVMQPGT